MQRSLRAKALLTISFVAFYTDSWGADPYTPEYAGGAPFSAYGSLTDGIHTMTYTPQGWLFISNTSPYNSTPIRIPPDFVIVNGNTVTYDFANMRMTDFTNRSNQSELDSALEKIRNELHYLQPQQKVRIDLKENYITDQGVQKLADMLCAQHGLFRDLASFQHLNLQNNNISEGGLAHIGRLLNKYPDLKIDLSINYIGLGELQKVFIDGCYDWSQRIKFRP